LPFKGGQSFSDVPIRRCVYPSYGLNLPNGAAPGTMIASYVWGQDSSRLGALRDQYVDYHAWDWYQNEWSVGAFAMFGPDQYSNIMPSLMTPAESGHVHWAGEALSSGHAWIIGAVNSAYRSVAEILKAEGRDDLIAELISKWGTIDEVDMGWYTTSDVGGP
jgi:hypothetical protein